jgi:transcriptional regulator with XRE-family HTH domain
MERLNNLIGDRIRNLRTVKGITQEELAHESFLHYNFLGKVERGEKGVSLESLVNITKALEVSLEEFFSTIDSKEENENGELQEILTLVRDRSTEEQANIVKVIRILLKMVDSK